MTILTLGTSGRSSLICHLSVCCASVVSSFDAPCSTSAVSVSILPEGHVSPRRLLSPQGTLSSLLGGDSMREAVERLWPEIDWIQNPTLREQVTQTWIKALERSPLKPDDLNQIPFTLLVPNCPITFMEHKRCVVHIARDSARAMCDFMGRALPIDEDVVIAGAILADVGKLLEYELGPDGKSRQSERGEALRHPFTGVALAIECGIPDAVCHIIAAHAAEGDLVKRTTEAFIVHHADFMAFLPFKNPKNVRVK
jgi:putative nucleotidyltransferase with HDIG domain